MSKMRHNHQVLKLTNTELEQKREKFWGWFRAEGNEINIIVKLVSLLPGHTG